MRRTTNQRKAIISDDIQKNRFSVPVQKHCSNIDIEENADDVNDISTHSENDITHDTIKFLKENLEFGFSIK